MAELGRSNQIIKRTIQPELQGLKGDFFPLLEIKSRENYQGL
jgi:hypothetical protein